MNDLLHNITPLFAFMLIPVWIPLIAMAAGAVGDRVRPRTDHPIVAEQARRREARAASVRALTAQPAT
jgi:hypothetical protein